MSSPDPFLKTKPVDEKTLVEVPEEISGIKIEDLFGTAKRAVVNKFDAVRENGQVTKTSHVLFGPGVVRSEPKLTAECAMIIESEVESANKIAAALPVAQSTWVVELPRKPVLSKLSRLTRLKKYAALNPKSKNEPLLSPSKIWN